jgi:hypothetical protein
LLSFNYVFSCPVSQSDHIKWIPLYSKWVPLNLITDNVIIPFTCYVLPTFAYCYHYIYVSCLPRSQSNHIKRFNCKLVNCKNYLCFLFFLRSIESLPFLSQLLMSKSFDLLSSYLICYNYLQNLFVCYCFKPFTSSWLFYESCPTRIEEEKYFAFFNKLLQDKTFCKTAFLSLLNKKAS